VVYPLLALVILRRGEPMLAVMPALASDGADPPDPVGTHGPTRDYIAVVPGAPTRLEEAGEGDTGNAQGGHHPGQYSSRAQR